MRLFFFLARHTCVSNFNTRPKYIQRLFNMEISGESLIQTEFCTMFALLTVRRHMATAGL